MAVRGKAYDIENGLNWLRIISM